MRILLIFLMFLLPACDDSSSPSGQGCTENRDCNLPFSCIQGRCVQECRRHADCAQGEICFDSVCYPPVDTCRTDVECEPFGEVCDQVNRRCVPPGGAICHPTLNPCPVGQVCQNEACRLQVADAGRLPVDASPRDATVPPPRDATVPPPRDATTPPPRDAAVPPPRDAAVPPPDAAVVGMGQYGDPCRCGSDCASSFCVENKLFNTRTCTDRCRNDGECPSLDVCLQVQAAGPSRECPDHGGGPAPGELVNVCIPNDTGFPCDLNAAQNPCLSGVCLRPPQPADWIHVQDQCAMFCQDDRKCPHGYRCDAIAGVQGRVCQPAVEVFSCPDGTIQQCGGVCPPAAGRDEADLALCINLQEGEAGYCSCTCSTARDCPVGFACSRFAELNTGDPQRTGICLAMSGYRCPGEIARPQEPQCPSLTCATDDQQAANSVCTAPCEREADCPPNHACRAIDGAPGLYCLAFQ